MSHTSHALSLEAHIDESFESQIRAQAQLRVLQARQHRAHHNAPPKRPALLWPKPATFGACSPRDRARSRKWQQAAGAAALAAFGAGLLWPVGSAPRPDLSAPQPANVVRIMPGELLASLDASAQPAR